MYKIQIVLILAISAFTLLASGCSEQDSEPQAKQDHIWKDQTDALEKAKNAADIMQKNTQEMNKKLQQAGE